MFATNIMSRIMSRRYHVLVSMIYGHDTGVARPGKLGYEMTNNLDLYLHIYQYHVISCDIMVYHVISSV